MQKLDQSEIEKNLATVTGWAYEGGFLCKEIKFSNFKEAMAFMVQVAFEAEALNHHPDWSNVYNTVDIKLQTHFVKGISELDFKLASKIDSILDNS